MIRSLLFRPLALLHTAALHLRHALYDAGVLESRAGALPTLVLGNLTVGGTGKTPLTERIVRDLESLLGTGKVGILSRGYGRKTRGFVWVETTHEAEEVGDEPLMLRRKLPHAPVAVCSNRLKGLEQMKADHPTLAWVVCDDAFQHRSLRPTITVLVCDTTQPLKTDALSPLGRLRDLKNRRHEADVAIFTRMQKEEPDAMETALYDALWPIDKPHFGSYMEAGALCAWPTGQSVSNGHKGMHPGQRERILAVAGIARPKRFIEGLAERFQVVRHETLPDHQQFTKKDIQRWRIATETDGLDAVIMTEKDAVRLGSQFLNGLNVRYEPLHARWLEESAFKSWLEQRISLES